MNRPSGPAPERLVKSANEVQTKKQRLTYSADIIEGVNTNLNNTNKIYTGTGCSITGMGQTAIADSFNCADGCGSASTRTDSYGDGFNNVNGGVSSPRNVPH